MRRDVDEALQGWPYDPAQSETIAREVRARDGRLVVQIRVELGLLQLEENGRPDGTRPHGFATYLDYLRYRAAGRGQGESTTRPFQMSADHCTEADREFVQYYHRRGAWLALKRYERALLDADHTLALMDFVCRHASGEEYVASHERFRGRVLMDRTRAAAALALERRRPEEAIDVVRAAAEQIRAHQAERRRDDDAAESSDQGLIEKLYELEQDIRTKFAVAKTLREQLDEAVAREDYERAARLRDQIRARTRH